MFLGRARRLHWGGGRAHGERSLASDWHAGKVERHGGLWQGMLRRVVWSKQVAGRDDVIAAATEKPICGSPQVPSVSFEKQFGKLNLKLNYLSRRQLTQQIFQ